MSDHPRSCGANDTAIFTVSRAAGSSPLVRGQLVFWWPVVILLRIIPARAGPTAETLRLAPSRADHPRSCGANINTTFYPHRSYGSSPLVRGQQRAGYRQPAPARIIPARAGPTMKLQRLLYFTSDHPRSCGANLFAVFFELSSAGSSPLVRGQRGIASRSGHQHRIIPARAGPTSAYAMRTGATQDHPRSCGANVVHGFVFLSPCGSSPLVRGQPAKSWPSPCPRRIIPARAGPTTLRIFGSVISPDHPRSCGANPTVTASGAHTCGSSPLVRGQPSRASRIRVDPRIIPARAGPTVRLSYEAGDDPDHPRSCGANR